MFNVIDVVFWSIVFFFSLKNKTKKKLLVVVFGLAMRIDQHNIQKRVAKINDANGLEAPER